MTGIGKSAQQFTAQLAFIYFMDIFSRFELAMQRIRYAGATDQPASANSRLAIAYSGGLDSTVLLHLCARYAQQYDVSFIAFHVHHGLSVNADHWALHSRERCSQLAIPFELSKIQLGSTQQDGVEATARSRRYAALGALCELHQIDILLTAHHQDDQAETMLLQLLRGSGVAGLRGMQQCHSAAGLLTNERLLLARPLLDFSRAELEHFRDQFQLQHIEDESNTDLRYARNALRAQIMPLLAQHFPGFQSRFARTAQHAQSSLELIEQLAGQDYVACRADLESTQLNVQRLQILPDARIDNVLRYWIALHRVQMPSSARLAEMRKQLLHARDDAQVCVKHGDIEVHRYRQRLAISFCAKESTDVQQFIWRGELDIYFPLFSGTLFLETVSADRAGIDRGWLIGQQLEMRPRRGGERLKLAANRPHRDMKSHYQSFGIPYWQRERLPFVFAGKDLLFAAGVGMHGAFLAVDGDRIALRWEAD